jgi:stage V sporulation protein K
LGNAALNKLGALPGMMEIKGQVEQIIQFNRISKLRKRQGLKTGAHSNHMVFTGSPGTGKTTAARLVGEAFASMGILKSKVKREEDSMPFVEVHHADITGSLVGEAEKNIKKKFEQARGGVLFIDEAYAFLESERSSHKTGEKVIATIVQLMEDMRDEILVIAAGYSREMDTFLDFNPGLRSRFTNIVNFTDYSVPDMIAIAQTMLFERDYQADSEYFTILANLLWAEKDKKRFGNARTVRNVIERSIRIQSVRVSQYEYPSREDLMLLTKEDIQEPGQVLLNEKDILLKALNHIQTRLLDYELKEIISRKSTVE